MFVQLLVSIISAIVFVACFLPFFRKYPSEEWLIHPFFYFSVFIFLGGPLRGIFNFVGVGYDYQANDGYRAIALIYVTAFYILTSVVFYACAKKDFSKPSLRPSDGPPPPHPTLADIPQAQVLLLFGIVVTALSFLYKWKTGSFGNLGENRHMVTGLPLALANLLLMTRYFFVGLSIVLWRQTKGIIYLLSTLGFCSSFILEALQGGGRASVLYVIIIIAILATRGGLKALQLALGVASVVFLLGLALLITFARTQGAYSRADKQYAVAEEFETARSELKYESLDQAEAMADRFSYYLDVFAIIIEKRADDMEGNRGIFALGSIADLSMIIPSFITRSLAHQGFDLYMGGYIMGSPWLRFPIGAPAESFFVLHYAGIIYGALYGWLCAFTYRVFYKHARCAFTVGVYYMILFLFCIAGSNGLMNNVVVMTKSLLLIAPVIFLIYFILMPGWQQRRPRF